MRESPPLRRDRCRYRLPIAAILLLAALQNNLQLQKQVGFLKDDIDVKKYSDLSMVTEAAKRLG